MKFITMSSSQTYGQNDNKNGKRSEASRNDASPTALTVSTYVSP